MKKIVVFLLYVAAFALASCGAKGIDKTYSGGGHEFVFKTNGTVVQSYMGRPAATYKYEVNGNEITVHLNENTSQVWTMQKDDGLSIPNVPFVLAVKR